MKLELRSTTSAALSHTCQAALPFDLGLSRRSLTVHCAHLTCKAHLLLHGRAIKLSVLTVLSLLSFFQNSLLLRLLAGLIQFRITTHGSFNQFSVWFDIGALDLRFLVRVLSRNEETSKLLLMVEIQLV